MHHTLSIPELWKNSDLQSKFLKPLKESSERFKREMDEGGGLEDEKSAGTVAELTVLDEAVERVEGAAQSLDK